VHIHENQNHHLIVACRVQLSLHCTMTYSSTQQASHKCRSMVRTSTNLHYHIISSGGSFLKLKLKTVLNWNRGCLAVFTAVWYSFRLLFLYPKGQGLKTKIKTRGVTSGTDGRLRKNHAKARESWPRFVERVTEPLSHRLKYYYYYYYYLYSW